MPHRAIAFYEIGGHRIHCFQTCNNLQTTLKKTAHPVGGAIGLSQQARNQK